MRSDRPPTRRAALARIAEAFGIRVAATPVCPGHCSPLDFLGAWCFDRPPVSLVLGPRGGGKSYLAAFATHWDSMRLDGHGTRILGGSLAQSAQVYDALRSFESGPGAVAFRSLNRESATYVTGSDVSILAASPKSVRGPHVATLRLDEVDEMETDIRESAMGMCMGLRGVSASVSMTSTWHRPSGPMAALIGRAKGGDFPLYTFCIFDVLERCPEERSGPNLERCPECPLLAWCHDGPIPKAKRSDGHYPIESLIQKVRVVSPRIFEADYLCAGPKADGLYFAEFSGANVTEAAEYDPSRDLYVAIDTGLHSGVVFFQADVRPSRDGDEARVSVFDELLCVDISPEALARRILEVVGSRPIAAVYADPAGDQRHGTGVVILGAMQASFGRTIRRWPIRKVRDSIEQLKGLILAADGRRRLTVHPRCTQLIRSLNSYRRRTVRGVILDEPDDPQHPAEDLVDALRGGIGGALGNWFAGRKSAGTHVPASKVIG